MKFFQQLLVAPAALGLVAPIAAGAAELNMAAVSQYSSSEQVTSISQFADVKPTDWAYQALSNLIERYGCVAGYPNGTYKGGQAMTRFEAAALLNACLDRVTETTDELQRLLNEFQKELAVLKGRVDGLDARVGELEATQFSTTTKLQGDTVFVVGANAFGGSDTAVVDRNKARAGAMVFNYDVRLNFLTSFTGKDLLYTRLRSGNFRGSPFAGNPYNLMALDRSFTPTGGNNVVNIDRLYYRFPIGKEFTALVGARARNTEFLAVSPSFYKSDILDVTGLHGAPGTYNKATGAAAGLMWKQKVKKGKPFFAISTSYVAPNANDGDPSAGGIMTDASESSWTTQLGVAAPQWKTTFAWRYGQCGQNFRRGTQFARGDQPCAGDGIISSAYSNNFALTAAWQPKKGGTLVPSISAGWGYNALSQAVLLNGAVPAYSNRSNIGASQSWQVGLQWKDAFAKGNSAGMAVGQPVFATSLRDGRSPNDGNYAWEWFYKFQVSDNISITPALFYLSRPDGQLSNVNGQTSNVFGGLIQTQFKF